MARQLKGKARKMTREEKRLQTKRMREAQEKCHAIIPYAAGAIGLAVLIVTFAF
jgi:hypothetical protein